MTSAPSSSPLPPLYDRWMRECLSGDIPNEPKATCHDCAMCQAQGGSQAPDDPVFFDPGSKCCTYVPMLWNFLVGALLEDDSPEAAPGRRTVEARIAAGIAVTPLGLDRTPVYATLYGHISEAFGRAQSMRCPHYIEEGGLCGVWRARESTCATWFCKHERGQVAKRFWQQLHRLLVAAERAVATWCVMRLDVGTDALAALLPFPSGPRHPVTAADFDGRAIPERLKLLWGRWGGRQEEFYRAAGRLARELAWADVLAIGGSELQAAVEITRAAFERLTSTRLPERLRAGAINLTPAPGGGALVTTYSPLDPLSLSPAVLKILPYFDGRTTRAARQAITRQLGLQVDSSLLLRLLDFGVLEDAGPRN
jgi:hypothetical protein